MILIEKETVINQSIEAVFERLIDIDGYSDWLPPSRVFINSKQTSNGSVGAGSTFEDTTRIGTFRGRVTVFQRPTNVAFRMRLHWLGVLVMESRPAYRLQALKGSTNLHLRAEGELNGPFKILKPYVAARALEERYRTVEILKESLETTSQQ
jgi:uncharacterized protein YndB with AHSA1/START domain